MVLSGLHFLLTYQCTLKCDHCFTWGSPWQQGTMTIADIHEFLQQAKDTGSITRIAFEGGVSHFFIIRPCWRVPVPQWNWDLPLVL